MRAVIDTNVLFEGLTKQGGALNAGAVLVTSNIKDFEKARTFLGVNVMKPVEFVLRLAE